METSGLLRIMLLSVLDVTFAPCLDGCQDEGVSGEEAFIALGA